MREEKFGCPNLECCYVGFSEGECPECGSKLAKPEGDGYRFNGDADEDLGNDVAPSMEFDDDPESGLWYSDGEESYGTM